LNVLRWTARVGSGLSLGVVVRFAVGEGLNLARFTPRELARFYYEELVKKHSFKSHEYPHWNRSMRVFAFYRQ
jgi:hypothetical protein